MRAIVSHLFRFTGLTTPSHDKLSLASLARCFHGNSWRAGCCEWVSRDVTNALPTAGVGNDSKNAHTPKESGWEGERGRKRQKEKRKYRDDSRTSVTGTGCGWKTQHCNSPCNYILIMHMEGIMRSDHRHPPDT